MREPNVWHTCSRVSNEIEKKTRETKTLCHRAFIDHVRHTERVVWIRLHEYEPCSIGRRSNGQH